MPRLFKTIPPSTLIAHLAVGAGKARVLAGAGFLLVPVAVALPTDSALLLELPFLRTRA